MEMWRGELCRGKGRAERGAKGLCREELGRLWGLERRLEGRGWGLILPAILSRGLCAPPSERTQTGGLDGTGREASPPAPPLPGPVLAPPLRNAALPLSRPHLRGPLLLTCTLAALRSLRGTALEWTGMWRTGSWRWMQWWPPQKKVVCRAGGQAGLWGGGSGYL